MSPEHDLQEFARTALEGLTGFPHAVFFQSGTAALEVILQLLSNRNDAIAIPAFGCWTVSYATTKLGRQPKFCDIDEYWSADVRESKADLALLIDPWGAPADWQQATDQQLIADMTLAPGARLHGAAPAESAVAGLISLGSNKPLSVGGGGVALFRDEFHAREAKRMYRFGFEDGRWTHRVERYSFSPYLLGPLSAKLNSLRSAEELAESAERDREVLASAGLSSNSMRPGGAWGAKSYLPVCLAADFPITSRDLEGVAICCGLRLARHPVSPAYLQPSWRDEGRGDCPNAENLASRCMFFTPAELGVEHVTALVEEVLESPDMFRTPFPLPTAIGELATDLERVATHGRLVRDLEGRYGLLEEAELRVWPIDEREAALVQSWQTERNG